MRHSLPYRHLYESFYSLIFTFTPLTKTPQLIMAERLKQLFQHLADVSSAAPPHPLDPLSSIEIEYAIALVRSQHGQLGYNAVTLSEPKKKEVLAWLADPLAPRPRRMAEVVASDKNSAVYDGIVDLKDGKITAWEKLVGVQPLVGLRKIPQLWIPS